MDSFSDHAIIFTQLQTGTALGGGSRGPDPPPSPDQGHLWETPKFDEFFWGGGGEES